MPDNDSKASACLLSILELGGYPDFTSLYRNLGYEVVNMQSMRKALKFIKNNHVDVIVAEFNFQSDFRDRTSQLESLMASIAQMPHVRVVVFYDKEQDHQFKRVSGRFDFFTTLTYPIQPQQLQQCLREISPIGVD